MPDNQDGLIWAAFGMIGLLVVMAGGIVISGIFLSPGSDTTLQQMIEGRIVSRAIVLFLIIPVITILCVQERISGEAALAALSAIAGYILGGTQAGQ